MSVNLTLETFKDSFELGNYEEAEAFVEQIISNCTPLSDEIVEYIFTQEDLLLISTFLDEYDGFTTYQKQYVNQFMVKNISHEDELLVSTIIDNADYFECSFFKECLRFAGDATERVLVVLSSVNYIGEYHSAKQIPEVVELFNKILESKEYYQNCQVTACFYLLRITNNPKYLTDLTDYIENGFIKNVIVLQNLMSNDNNQLGSLWYTELTDLVNRELVKRNI